MIPLLCRRRGIFIIKRSLTKRCPEADLSAFTDFRSPHFAGGGKWFTIISAVQLRRLLKKKCRILPAGGLGVSPSYKTPPRLGDIGG
jgi:hypothetical protein